MSFDFAPRQALVTPLRTKFALSGERVFFPLVVEA
jgi:hypothetical protein